MSYADDHGRVTAPPVRTLDGIPEANLPQITRVVSRPATTASQPSSRIRRVLRRGERCFLTRTICYTHKQAHFLNAVRHADGSGRKEDIENIIIRLGIVSEEFDLDSAENLVNLDRVVHKAMDTYALIAFTCASETLDDLTNLIKTENDGRQRLADEAGVINRRYFDFMADSFRNPKYELVALYPEHFLPSGRTLAVFDPTTSTTKTYVPSRDRMLREAQDPSSLQLPSFYFTRGPDELDLNPFLVVLCAGIKFRRFIRDIEASPPLRPLPHGVMQLVNKTIELVDLLYHEIKPRSETRGETILSLRRAQARRNAPRQSRPESLAESDNGIDMSGGEDGNVGNGGTYQGRTRREFVFPEGASLERRIEIAEALMSGHHLDMDSDDESVLEELRSGSNVPLILQGAV